MHCAAPSFGTTAPAPMKGSRMSGQARLLVVDDEPSLQDIVATSMRFLGYQVAVAATGREAVRMATDTHPDLIILDVMLPDFDGLEVMKRVRAAGVASGVVFLSARDTPADKIAGLTAGGDDYVTKPFGLEELAARVAAVLRRTRPDTDDDGVLRVADLQLDPETYQVTRDGVPIELAPTEYKMLRHLMINANVVLSRQQLLDAVWGTDFYGDDSVVADLHLLPAAQGRRDRRAADPHPSRIRLRAPRPASTDLRPDGHEMVDTEGWATARSSPHRRRRPPRRSATPSHRYPPSPRSGRGRASIPCRPAAGVCAPG